MKILGVIPARYASSRFPGKPLTEICGKPMIYWVYRQAQKVQSLNEVIVATEDNRIVDACSSFGINVILTSDRHLTGTDRLGEVAQKADADYYVNIQGDEPLIEPRTIESIIEKITMKNDFEVINSMTKIKNDSDIASDTCVKVVASNDGRVIYFSRSPIPFPKNGQMIEYYKHLGLYALSRKALLWFANQQRGAVEKIEDIEMMRFLENGYPIDIICVQSDSIAVDRPDDVLRVEEEMRKRGL